MANVRTSTCRLIELAENGVTSWEDLARSLLDWMSESDVSTFASDECYFDEEDEEE